jgi:aminopeptidase N
VADIAGRSTLLAVRSYDVDLDVAADNDSFSSRTEIRFRCHQPGAASVADLDASAIRQVVLNGAEPDPSAASHDGQLRLPGLAAENVLTVDAGFAYASAGAAGLHRRIWSGGGGCVFSKPMPDGGRHIFCCSYQEDLRAPVTLSVTAPAGWSCLANGAAVSERAGPQQRQAILDGVNVLINEHRNECITGADLAGCLSRASGHDVRVVDLEPA